MRIPRFQPAFHADALHRSIKCSTCIFSSFCLSISNTHTHTHTHTWHTDRWPDKGGSRFQFIFILMRCSGRCLHIFPSTLTWPPQQPCYTKLSWRAIKTPNDLSSMQRYHLDRKALFDIRCCRVHLGVGNGFLSPLLGFCCKVIDCSQCKVNSHHLIILWVHLKLSYLKCRR